MTSPAPHRLAAATRVLASRVVASIGVLLAAGTLVARAAVAAPVLPPVAPEASPARLDEGGVLAGPPAARGPDEGALPAGLLEGPPRLFTNKLDDPASPSLGLLRAFHDASIERPAVDGSYLASPWGRWGKRPWWSLDWRPTGRLAEAEPPAPLAIPLPEGADDPLSAAPPLAGLVPDSALRPPPEDPEWLRRLLPDFTPSVAAWTGPSLRSDGYDTLWAPPPKPIPWWKCNRRATSFVRYGGESDTFALLRCDGSVAPEAIDRLSLIARPADAPRPGALLPDEPDPEAWSRGEWIPRVRLVNPRLVWLLQRIAEAFPRKAIYVYSGYRPRKAGSKHDGGHHSQHADGRAMDIGVFNVPNVALFKLCRTLDDVGCGYYPNSKFVHVDVRRPGTGHAFWIDASAPGEPSRYVDAWPGVVESGALVWGGAH
jgi:hypothetical protein